MLQGKDLRLASGTLCQASKAPGLTVRSQNWGQRVVSLCSYSVVILASAATVCVPPAAASSRDLAYSSAAIYQATQQSQQLPVPQRPWLPCKPKTSCVSTNSIMSPAQYMPPWSFAPDSKQAAFGSVMSWLQECNATILDADTDAGYIAAHLPLSSSSSKYDTLQLLLQPDGVVLFKSQASLNKPDPPFCLTPGCISGPSNRGRLDALRDALGWTVLETDEDKEWVQILLH